ncbi:MAG: alpha/beta hydrolase [Chloroflexi bacterium]|nr:alpha/beta hydrolase [Chloroflexota bacterium]
MTETSTLPRSGFEEKFVDADGFLIRYLEAGSGPPLVYVHSAGGLRLSRAHELLAASFRVVAFEVPGFSGPANERSRSHADVGASLVRAARQVGLERFNLWGTSFGGAVALWAAIGAPEAIDALVLDGCGAIEPPGGFPAVRSPEELHQYFYAHPDRHPLAPPLDPALLAQRRALLGRMRAVPRAEVEQALTSLDVPTLVIFGTHDRLTPPELGRIYRDKMPRCHLVLLYDAGHEAAAERPEAFASLVQDFLRRREAFVVNDKSSRLYP